MKTREIIYKILLLCCLIFVISSWKGCCYTQVAPKELSVRQCKNQDSTIVSEQSLYERELTIPDSAMDNNQHDWIFLSLISL